MERQLASIKRVIKLEPITGADFIERAFIDGWQCIVKKGEFSIGDLGLFLEIDSVPPQQSAFEWLWMKKDSTDNTRPANFRIRTMKIRGVLSQGVLIPIDTLAEAGLLSYYWFDIGFEEGDDLTEVLGITKYEPPTFTNSRGPSNFDCRGTFPSMVPKTDEIRIQSVPAVLEELRGHPYVITEKCDGTSATFLIDPRDNEFHACSRNYSIKDGDNIYWNIAKKYGIEEKLRQFPQYVIQGEIVGPGIQKNPMGLASIELRVFNVFDLSEGNYVPHWDAERISLTLNIPVVSWIDWNNEFNYTQEELLFKAEGKYEGTKNEREGIVVRSVDNMYSEALKGRLSFKVISNKYLLKED